ncbi:MAG: hypothetical protein Q6L55_05550 [Gloeomargarita sp. SRBZ-1_bins_9]
MRQTTLSSLILATLLAGNLTLPAKAQIKTLQTTVQPPPTNQPINLPPPVPPIPQDSKPANTGGTTMPNVNPNMHHNLFNSGNANPAGVPGAVGQERILQIDPRIFGDIPEAARRGAEAQQVQNALNQVREATNVLPEGTRENPLDRNRENLGNPRSRQGDPRNQHDDPLFGLQEDLNSRSRSGRNSRYNGNGLRPGMPSQDSLLMDGGGAKQSSGDSQVNSRIYTSPDGYTYKITSWTTRDDRGTVRHSTVVAQDGRTFTVESRGTLITTPSGRTDVSWENRGTYHDPNTGETRTGRQQSDLPLDDLLVWEFIARDERRRGITRNCAPDDPCGDGPAIWEIVPGLEHLRPKSVVEQLRENPRPGAQVNPDGDYQDPASVPRLTIGPLAPVVNPGFEPATTGGNPDPSRFERRDQVNPGCRPNGC